MTSAVHPETKSALTGRAIHWLTRFTLVLILTFTIVIEAIFAPLLLNEIGTRFPETQALIVPAAVGIALLLLCFQAMLVVTWILTSLARDDRILSSRALRLVGLLTALPFAAAISLASAYMVLSALRLTPPSVMYALLGAVLLCVTLGLVLLSMRSLLVRFSTLHTEMSEVV